MYRTNSRTRFETINLDIRNYSIASYYWTREDAPFLTKIPNARKKLFGNKLNIIEVRVVVERRDEPEQMKYLRSCSAI